MNDESERPVVLAVDDTPENLDVVKGILVPDYRVKAATSGAAALRIVEKQPPDIILLDIMMPEMSGLEVCRRLKANPLTADIPVIFLTAKDQTADEAEGFLLGAADYILKPVRPPILKARVKTHVALKQSIDSLQETSDALAVAKKRMEQELNVGRDIQESMMPHQVPDRPEINLVAHMNAAREVGGDFYDYNMLNEDELYFCVADVSGKGVPSALFMAMSKILMKSRAVDNKSPAEILSRVNSELSEDNPECMFVTVFLGVLTLSTGELLFTNAGHNPPLIRRAGGGVDVVPGRHGPAIGIVPGTQFKESTLQLQPGDVLLVFTDGVTEAMDTSRNLYSDERLMNLLEDLPESGAAQILNAVRESVDEFARGAEQADDITMITLQYNGCGSARRPDLRISLKNRLNQVEVALTELDAFAADNKLDNQTAHAARLALDELLNNTISYGYDEGAEGGEGQQEITINMAISNGNLEIVLKDGAKPFNPFEQAPPNLDLPLEEREVGGLGIHLVRKFIDHYDYQYQDGMNIVTLRRALS